MSLASQDFIRRMPDSAQYFSRRNPLWQRLHLDPWLLLLITAIVIYGLFVLYSASGGSERMVRRQFIYFIVACTCMCTMAQISLQFLRRWAPWFYALGLILLLLVYFFGVGAKGAQRWLSLGFMQFQPSEALKIIMPIAVAAYCSSRVLPPQVKHVVWCLVIILVPAALILKQPDLGTAILISASGLIALFLAGLRWRYIVGALAVIGASIWPMWHYVMEEYQKQRVLTLLDPEADKLGAGWNIIQSKTAIGSGGVHGKGWLHGTQSQLDFLPESHTDFIIAVMAEDFGFKGVLVLIALYTMVIARGLYISARANDSFARLLGGSITLTFFVYVFVNIGMVSGLLPVVGVPLPLVSYGGTSMVTLLAGFGIIMAIATEPKKVS